MNLKPILIAILLCANTLTSVGQRLEAFYSNAFFLHPEQGPFMESYLAINGATVNYQPNEDGDLQGKVEVTTLYLQKDSIVFYDKYEVLSPVLAPKAKASGNFIDVQRVALPNGVYQFEMQIKDLNAENKSTFSYHDVLVVKMNHDSLFISDVELIESYERVMEANNLTKGGVTLVPYTSNFYPEEVETMIFYAEIYNSAKVLGSDQGLLINFFIESQDSEQPLSQYSKFKKVKALEVNVLFNQFSIVNLPSGNYNLVVEVRDRNNELKAVRKVFFQKSNPNLPVKQENLAAINVKRSFFNDIPKDSLQECVRCIAPISSTSERQYAESQLRVADEDLMIRYLQHFWEQRAPLQPESLWLDYSAQVKRVQREYGRMIVKGYETDRGRVYLQYGQANSVEVRNMDPALYPYEIWHYYKVEGMSNAKFIFYNPELVDDMYELLHSNVRGEPSDPAWHYKLQNLRPNNVDELMNPNSFDSRAKEFWSNPK